jgi:murein L,D-transpeptidase YcbB/YkuD
MTPPTRRIFLASLGAASVPVAAAPQSLPDSIEPTALARLRQAQEAIPAANARGKLAVARTLDRLGDAGIDLSAGRVILVNIAAAELIAYDNGREAMRSRVIVGTERTRTPQLATFVTSVRYNPPWYVPASIEPEVRAAGAVGFRTVNGRLVQPPGPTNPLGPLRIGLHDSDGIFLHGTSNPSLFGRATRTLSHGCVRVERVRDLAAWLLDVTPAAVQATLGTGRTFDTNPSQDVQVVLGYLTAWLDAQGRLALHGDPYGLDAPGARRAGFRRVQRPIIPAPVEPEPEDNPL